MTVGQLLTWQWQGYARYHQNTTNLLLHIVAVPLFIVANVLLIVAVVKVSLGLLALAVLGIVVSVIVQGRGHKLERVPPEPFTGPANVPSPLPPVPRPRRMDTSLPPTLVTTRSVIPSWL